MSVANSYANALYEALCDSKQKEQVSSAESKLLELVAILNSSVEARVALISPLATIKEKTALIQELAKKQGLSEIEARFILLLVKKGRLDLLEKIVEAFHTLRLIRDGGLPAQLTVAEPMSDSDIDILSKVLGKKLGKKVTFQVSTDPSLLAGMKVTVNGVTYDGTLRSQLQKLRDRFVTGLSGTSA
jgi:F-type H+-transporting ATPase subunit delta